MNPLRRLSDRWRREHRTGLNHHIPLPPPGGEWQAVVDAVFAPPDCHDCTPGWACRVHDGCYWRALEATEGLDHR